MHRPVGNEHGSKVPVGLKPKDLIGQPWAVAFALRQPYYSGRIRDERDRIWLAAMIDAEGSIGINLQRGGRHRARDVYSVSVKVHNCSENLVRRCAEISGVGSVALAESRRRPVFVWSVYGEQARALLRELYPHFVAKKHEARLAHSHTSGVDDGAKMRYEALRLLHSGSETCVDAPAPESCFEPGWYLRSCVIWHKPNPMPESVTDRPTTSHEYVFLLTKQARYFYDQEAVREPQKPDGRKVTTVKGGDGSIQHRDGERWPNPAGRNLRSVWTIPTQPYPEAHVATYPEELVRRCLLAGCPEWVCRTCGKPRERIVEKEPMSPPTYKDAGDETSLTGGRNRNVTRMGDGYARIETLGFTDCGHNDYRPGIVLDPFLGSGTTAHVARKHGRKCIGIELNPDYCELAARRLAQLSLLAEGA
jgi:hypothetical protein